MEWREHIPFQQGLALILVFLTVLLPLLVYRDFAAILGESPHLKIIGIAALGAAASSVLYVEPGERLLAVLPGLVAGGSTAALHMAYVDNARSSPDEWVPALLLVASAIGAAMWLLLMWALRRVVHALNQD